MPSPPLPAAESPGPNDSRRWRSLPLLVTLVIAALAIVAAGATGLRAIEARESAVATDQVQHHRLTDARTALESNPGFPAFVAFGPPPPPGATLPQSLLDLRGDIEIVLQILREIADTGSPATAPLARETIEPLEQLSLALTPAAPGTQSELLDGRKRVRQASTQLHRLVDAQQRELATQQVSLVSTTRWYAFLMVVVALAALAAVSVVYFRMIATQRQGLAELEASARRLADLAVTDSLTGLANQREFQIRLETEVERARRHGRPLSLILLDLDHFKRVNDAHGHQVGDAVLVETAARLAGLARTGETVARVGGEEFAWLVPETTQLDAFLAAERARREILRLPYADAGWLTISCGVAQLADAENASALVRQADSALYWAKHHGRNATFCYSESVAREMTANEENDAPEHGQTLDALRALAQAIDARHPGTRHHSRRVAEISEVVARRRGWSPEDAMRLRDAALVHDVGMVQVPDEAFLTEGPLDAAARAAVQAHPMSAAVLVSEVLDDDQTAWVAHHHERWDGSGYPDGLQGDTTPDGARILAVAEAWDALQHPRPHRPPFGRTEALAELERLAGVHFCPETVAALAEAHQSKELPGVWENQPSLD